MVNDTASYNLSTSQVPSVMHLEVFRRAEDFVLPHTVVECCSGVYDELPGAAYTTPPATVVVQDGPASSVDLKRGPSSRCVQLANTADGHRCSSPPNTGRPPSNAATPAWTTQAGAPRPYCGAQSAHRSRLARLRAATGALAPRLGAALGTPPPVQCSVLLVGTALLEPCAAVLRLLVQVVRPVHQSPVCR